MKPDKKLVSTITNKIMKKEKKITTRFFLRKDQGQMYNRSNGVFYYPLYIDFIHRRKKGRCRSLFAEFAGHINTSCYTMAVNDEVLALVNAEFQPARSYQLDVLDLLVCEKKHAVSLFMLFGDIEKDDFALARLSEGYKYSFKKRVYELCDEVLRELLLETFLHYVVNFLSGVFKKAMPNCNYQEFSHLVNMTSDNYGIDDSYFIHFCKNLNLVESVVHEYFNAYSCKHLALTIPIWLVEEHSNQLSTFLLDEDRSMDSVVVSNFIAKLDVKIAEEVSSIKHFFKS